MPEVEASRRGLGTNNGPRNLRHVCTHQREPVPFSGREIRGKDNKSKLFLALPLHVLTKICLM